MTGNSRLSHLTGGHRGAQRGAAALWGQPGRWTVVSSQEQRMWDDVRLLWAVEAEEPPRFEPSAFGGGWLGHDQDELPLALAAGVWIAVALILFGVVLVGLAVAGVTAAGWALWRSRPGAGRAVPGRRRGACTPPATRRSGAARLLARRRPGQRRMPPARPRGSAGRRHRRVAASITNR
jgi:hypothetical protein